MHPPKRILIVDDEEPNRELLHDLLASLGHESEMVKDGFEALAQLDPTFDLVLLDVMMPGMNGFDVARRIRTESCVKDIPIIMVTALNSRQDRLNAVEAGANDFIAKPIDRTELKVRTTSLLKMKAAQDEIKQHQAMLEDTVAQRTADLRKALQEAAEAQHQAYAAYLSTLERLAIAAEYKDEDTAAHLHRMSRYCVLIAEGLSLPSSEIEIIRIASPMHDVGKIGIPDAILLKPGELAPQEWDIMKQHTIIGSRILGASSSELLKASELIAISHHEKWDGSGYPNGIAGEEIPVWGRICAVADVFDALTSRRPYKEAYPNETALGMMKVENGKHFDPQVLAMFFERLTEVLAIQHAFSE